MKINRAKGLFLDLGYKIETCYEYFYYPLPNLISNKTPYFFGLSSKGIYFVASGRRWFKPIIVGMKVHFIPWSDFISFELKKGNLLNPVKFLYLHTINHATVIELEYDINSFLKDISFYSGFRFNVH